MIPNVSFKAAEADQQVMPFQMIKILTLFKPVPCRVTVGDKMTLTLRERKNDSIEVFHGCEVIEMKKTTCNGEDGYEVKIALPDDGRAHMDHCMLHRPHVS